jgi:predicted unusual protein kinase regulating ubiquinone biosynthesis (AarF/ABC1/UbiB family)
LGLPKDISDSILGSTWERRELLRRQLLSCAKQSHHRKTYLEGNPPSIFKPSAKKYLKNLDRLSNMNLLALKDMGLAAISDPSMAELITSVLAKFVDSIDYLKKEDSSDPGRNLLRAFFLNYFNSAGPLVRRDLVSGLFNGKVDQVSDEALHNILDSSGPVMHKALQLLSENANSEKVKNLLNNFKSNIKPMGEAELDLAKEKAFQGKEAKYLKEFNPRPLAVASIGEVHLARSVKDNRELVVKLKKPDLLAKSTEEFAQMQRIVENMGNTPALVDIVAAMKKSMAQELNFVREVRKLKQGQIYARPQQGINVVEPLEDAEFEDAIVMEKAKGENIHKIVDDPESICVKSKFLTEIMSNWISAALFGNGYFNGDFHAGNILLDFQANQASEVTLIDFGNSKHLSRVERTALIELIIGANYDDAAMISSAFHNIQSSNTGSDAMKSKLEAMTQRAFQENSASEKVSYLLKNAISDGFHLSDGIVLFNRGRMLLEKQIKAINLKIANGEAPSCRETKIADIYKDKFKEGFTKPAVIWMFGVNRSRELKKKINAIKAQKEAETLSKTLGRAPTRNLLDSEFRSDLLS